MELLLEMVKRLAIVEQIFRWNSIAELKRVDCQTISICVNCRTVRLSEQQTGQFIGISKALISCGSRTAYSH